MWLGGCFWCFERGGKFFAKRKEVGEKDCLARGLGVGGVLWLCRGYSKILVVSKCVTVARGELLQMGCDLVAVVVVGRSVGQRCLWRRLRR